MADLQVTQSKEQISEAPFGVPFSSSTSRQAITEQAFRGKRRRSSSVSPIAGNLPTTLFELNGWLEKSIRTHPAAGYFVTVDPERDTPELLNNYISNVTKRVIGIAGPRRRWPRSSRASASTPRDPAREKDPNGDYTMDHTASVFLLDAEGRFKGPFPMANNPDVACRSSKISRTVIHRGAARISQVAAAARRCTGDDDRGQGRWSCPFP